MPRPSRPPEEFAHLDLRQVEFPSDALSIKRLRQLFPEDFDRDEPWENGSCAFFSPGSPRGDQQLEQLNSLLMLERIVVQAAFYLQLGGAKSFHPGQLEDGAGYKRDLEQYYQGFKKAMAIFTKLPSEVRAMVESGDLKSRAAYALSKLSDIPTILDLAAKAVSLPMAVESVEEAVSKLLGTGKKTKDRPTRFSTCGITGTIKGNPLAALKAFHAKSGEVLKQVERNPALAEVLPSLLKG